MARSLRKVAYSEDRHIIVQCPSCQTKFAVDNSLVAGLEAPRFHCSRCDHVFSFASPSSTGEEAGTQAETSQLAEAPSLFEESAENSDEPMHASFPEDLDEEETQGAFVTPLGSRSSAPHESAPELAAHESAPNPEPAQVQNQWSRFASRFTSRDSFDANAAREVSIRHEPPHEHIEQIPLSFSPSESLSDTALASRPSEIRQATSARDLLGSPDEYLPPSLIPDEAFGPEIESAALPSTALPRATRPWVSFAWVCAPIVAFLCILASGSVLLASSERAAESVSSLLYPSAPQVAPADLMIRNARFKKVVLDSGETVRIISGELVNGSDRTFRDVLVEGMVFDSNGMLVDSVRAHAASGLAKTRLKSLSPDMIESFQARELVRRFELRPGERHEFMVALLSPESASARFFSTRVYSVR